jgi:hypothetical protein
MFTYKVSKSHLIEGLKVKVKGEKNNVSHEFITRIEYRELEKRNYEDIVDSLVEALEKKIDLLIMNNIY